MEKTVNPKHSVAVLGAGIAGISVAYYLAKAGAKVVVYDQEGYAGMQCSYANGGQLSVSNSETWHSFANIMKGAKWITKKDAPLLIRPSLDLDKAKWVIGFLWDTIKGKSKEYSTKTILMGLEARQLYEELRQEEGLSYDHSASGILHFYKNEKYFKSAKAAQSLYESNGCEWKILSSSQVLEKEPNLKHAKGIIGGTWTQDDSVGDIHKFCHELMQVLVNKYGVEFKTLTTLVPKDLELLKKQFDKVVIALGANSLQFAKYLGDPCSIYPIKGYSITLMNPGQEVPNVSLLDDEAKIVTSTLGGRLRVAGTAELAGFNTDITKARVEPLVRWVQSNFPNVSTREYQPWACLRPMTSSMMPMVGPSVKEGVFYHTGHGHLGWTLAPSTAKRLVHQMTGV